MLFAEWFGMTEIDGLIVQYVVIALVIAVCALVAINRN